MNAVIAEPVPGRWAKALALASLVFFWVLPFSPILAIGAVSLTRGASGWSRRVAVLGAGLCASYTIVLAVFVIGLALQLRW